MQFQPLEDPLEKRMTTHSSILAWRIPWTEEPGGYSPLGCHESDTNKRLSTHGYVYVEFCLYIISPLLKQ